MHDRAEKQKPTRDVREQPVSNPNGPALGKVEPTAPIEVPLTDEHVPLREPARVPPLAAQTNRGEQPCPTTPTLNC